LKAIVSQAAIYYKELQLLRKRITKAENRLNALVEQLNNADYIMLTYQIDSRIERSKYAKAL